MAEKWNKRQGYALAIIASMGLKTGCGVFIGFLPVCTPITQTIQRNFLPRHSTNYIGAGFHDCEIGITIMDLSFALILKKTVHAPPIQASLKKAKTELRITNTHIQQALHPLKALHILSYSLVDGRMAPKLTSDDEKNRLKEFL
jgi:hypothetical protein